MFPDDICGVFSLAVGSCHLTSNLSDGLRSVAYRSLCVIGKPWEDIFTHYVDIDILCDLFLYGQGGPGKHKKLPNGLLLVSAELVAN